MTNWKYYTSFRTNLKNSFQKKKKDCIDVMMGNIYYVYDGRDSLEEVNRVRNESLLNVRIYKYHFLFFLLSFTVFIS